MHHECVAGAQNAQNGTPPARYRKKKLFFPVACWRCAVSKWLIITLKRRAGRLGQQLWLIIAVKRRAGRLGQQLWLIIAVNRRAGRL